MSEELQTRIRWLYEVVYGQGDVDARDEPSAADGIRHGPPMPGVAGLQAFKDWMMDVTRAYTDLHMTVLERKGH